MLVLLLIGGYASVLIPALDGKQYATKSGFALMFWSGLTFWYFWKIENRKTWVGAIIGVVIGVFVSILIVGLGTAIGGEDTDYVLAHTAPYPAIKQHFPEAYEDMRRELSTASKGKKLTVEDIIGILGTKVVAVGDEAVKTTSDDAILQLGGAKLSWFRDVSKKSPADCYLMMSGELATADPAAWVRVLKSMSSETKVLTKQATQKVLEDVNTQRKVTGSEAAEAHFDNLLTQLDAILTKKYSLSAYYFTDDSLNKPSAVRCAAGLALFEEIMNLPSDERTFILRRFFTASQ
jgi:hypothetical protein